MRIISVVPSQTELLFDLGLDQEVVGITKFCIHPHNWFKTKNKIGGTKTLNIEKIKKLQPDLILANKEENVKEQIEELSLHCEVFVSDIKTIEDNIDLIHQIGHLTNTKDKAEKLIYDLKKMTFNHVDIKALKKTLYLIWKDPYMTVGGDTFIHNVMLKCGFDNALKNKERYPQITLKEMKELKPEIIMLSSEPFPFKEKHIEEIQNELPDSNVILVDGEAFSWYGTRLIKKEKYLKTLIDM